MRKRQRKTAVDREKWSAASKRSVSYEIHRKRYVDQHYYCWRCSRPAVFTAEDQKYTFEVRKAHIWQGRKLCTSCWRVRLRLEKGIANCEARWKSERASLSRDGGFQQGWLDALEELPHYGAR